MDPGLAVVVVVDDAVPDNGQSRSPLWQLAQFSFRVAQPANKEQTLTLKKKKQ